MLECSLSTCDPTGAPPIPATCSLDGPTQVTAQITLSEDAPIGQWRWNLSFLGTSTEALAFGSPLQFVVVP